MLYTYACKTLKPGFFWYVVDTNLFRLGSINPKKKYSPWFYFWILYRGLIVRGFLFGWLLSGGFLSGGF